MAGLVIGLTFLFLAFIIILVIVTRILKKNVKNVDVKINSSGLEISSSFYKDSLK